MLDYLAFGFVLGAVDNNMSNMRWCEMDRLGYNKIADTLRRYYSLRVCGNECVMGDYADFNRQHMLRVLSLRYAALEEACRRKGVTNQDCLRALEWCQKSLLKCYVYFPNGANSTKTYREVYSGTAPSGRSYSVQLPTADGAKRVHQGMFSGHRGTSNDNTSLNIAYVDVVVERYGVMPEYTAHMMETTYG